MNRAVNEILQQAWERGRKYGNEEKKDVEERTIKEIAKLDENGEIKIELLRPQADEGAIEILTNYEKTACHDCILRPCSVPLDKAIEYIRSYCNKHTCWNCKFSKNKTELCMFGDSPCNWKTDAEIRGEK